MKVSRLCGDIQGNTGKRRNRQERTTSQARHNLKKSHESAGGEIGVVMLESDEERLSAGKMSVEFGTENIGMEQKENNTRHPIALLTY
jgi:hypothetical protein